MNKILPVTTMESVLKRLDAIEDELSEIAGNLTVFLLEEFETHNGGAMIVVANTLREAQEIAAASYGEHWKRCDVQFLGQSSRGLKHPKIVRVFM